MLDALEKITVGVECQRRWREDREERLKAAQEAAFSRSDYRQLAAENLNGLRADGAGWFETCRAEDLKDDIEGAIKEMADVPVDNLDEPAPRVFRFQVTRPYRLKAKIIAEVSVWASAKFGKRISPGIVQSAWRLMRQVEADTDV